MQKYANVGDILHMIMISIIWILGGEVRVVFKIVIFK